MKFIDFVTISVSAGNGGRGCVSFRREKYVPRGGPDGGDGGRGGHVIVHATSEMNTLLDLRYPRQYNAQRGQHGMGKKMHGKNGEDLIIPVPVGTIVRDTDTGEAIADLDCDGAESVVARGGRGGLGNANFVSSVRQAPRFAQPGEPGEERNLTLELKLLADVGLVGLPNAGKSTLISVITSARPKIADYPFTTLVPNLGVVKYADSVSFVVADIPGLIEGAHRGAGLGFQFLRHVERSSILLHLVDASDSAPSDPVSDFETVNTEIARYGIELSGRPMAAAGTKCDIAPEGERLRCLSRYCRQKNIDFFPVSAVTGSGIGELVRYLAEKVRGIKTKT